MVCLCCLNVVCYSPSYVCVCVCYMCLCDCVWLCVVVWACLRCVRVFCVVYVVALYVFFFVRACAPVCFMCVMCVSYCAMLHDV